jgi:hypothetical protein
LNLRRLGPEPSALPGCATLRISSLHTTAGDKPERRTVKYHCASFAARRRGRCLENSKTGIRQRYILNRYHGLFPKGDPSYGRFAEEKEHTCNRCRQGYRQGDRHGMRPGRCSRGSPLPLQQGRSGRGRPGRRPGGQRRSAPILSIQGSAKNFSAR